MRARRDDYSDLEPQLAEYAQLRTDDPRRRVRRDRLVAEFLPVARHIAARYTGRGEPTDDLEQVAGIGLMKALERYDPTRGDFLAYAVPTITGELRRHFRDTTWTVRTPRAIKDRSVEIHAATPVLAQELGRAPTAAELAARGAHRPTSLDAMLPGQDDAGLLDLVGGLDPDLEHVEARAVAHGLVAELPERERRILVLRFVEERTQREIGAELGISQMHVSRLLTRILAVLREEMGREAEVPAPRSPGVVPAAVAH